MVWGMGWDLIGCFLLLFLSLYVSFAFALKAIGGIQRKTRIMRVYSPKLMMKLSSSNKHSEGVLLRKRLLAECGLSWQIQRYMAFRTLGFLMCGTLVSVGSLVWQWHGLSVVMSPGWLIVSGLIGLTVCMFDHIILRAYRKRRTQRIVNELYIISHHLLYYADSKLNLHTKLMRCLPYAGAIKSELQLLLSDWYYDAEAALRRFQTKLGTEDGYRFVETIQSIRLYDHEHYYELLRQRIEDYKEKLELYRVNRKEKNSYMLFVLAGIPIFNTFRLFIYPWVSEGQKLFEALN